MKKFIAIAVAALLAFSYATSVYAATSVPWIKDTGVLYIPYIGDKVGIGTTSPYAKLSVVGEIVGAFFTGTSTATSSLPILSIGSRFLGAGLSDCDADNQTLSWDASTWTFGCGDDDTGVGGTGLSTSSPVSAGNVLVYSATGAGSAFGVATGTLSATSPLSASAARSLIGGAATLSIADAVADGATKGAASFTANDFDASSGNISIDYTNGQAAGTGVKGFLTGTDWDTFNGKENVLTAGDGITRTANDLDCDIASGSVFGCLSTTDWTAFNAKQAALTFTYPLVNTANTVSLAFGTTTQNFWSAYNNFSSLFATNATTTNATTTGAVNLSSFTSALLQVDAQGDVEEYAGTSCTNQFVRSLSALGVATCETVANTDLANSTVSYGGVTLSLGGSDATPAFDLTDATQLPIVNGTTGTLTIARGGTATTTAYDTGLFFYNGTLGTYSQASRAANHELVWDRTTPGFGVGTSTPWGLLSVGSSAGFTAGAPQFVVGSSTATAFIVDQGRRVGVSTTSPSSNYTFSVTGTGYFSGGVTLGTPLTVPNGGTGVNTCTDNRLITGTGVAAFTCEANATFTGSVLTVTGTAVVSTSVTSPIYYGGSVAGSTLTLRSTSGAGVGADAIIFGIANNGATEVARMNLGGTGFGTTTPRWTLQLASSTKGQLALSDGSATSNHWVMRAINNWLYIGTSSPATYASSTQTAIAITPGGQFSTLENIVATSSAPTLDWNNTPNQILYRIGTAATTIGFNNASTTGMTKRITVCNPGGTAGAITWSVNTIRWVGGTIPTQTTTANKCDVYSFIVTAGTSTTVILGAQSANF